MSLQDKIEKAVWATGKVERQDLRAVTEAVMGTLRRVDAVEHAKPVILYLKTDEDREELIAAVHEVKPDMVPVRVD